MHYEKELNTNSPSNLVKENIDGYSGRINRSLNGPYSEAIPSLRRMRKDAELPNFKNRLKSSEIIHSYVSEGNTDKKRTDLRGN